jgi:hypothetical protein
MAFFEASKLKDSNGTVVNPAQEESLTLLRSIFRLLKPLGMITGSQSNRLSVDINTGTIATVSNLAAGTVTANCNINATQTLATVSTVTNVANTGGVNTFDLMKAMSRTAYNSGIRSNLT